MCSVDTLCVCALPVISVNFFSHFFASFPQFAPEIHVGDGLGMDLKLPNQVFNSLKQHCYSEQRRSARLHEKKEHSTAVSMTSPTKGLSFIYQGQHRNLLFKDLDPEYLLIYRLSVHLLWFYDFGV